MPRSADDEASAGGAFDDDLRRGQPGSNPQTQRVTSENEEANPNESSNRESSNRRSSHEDVWNLTATLREVYPAIPKAKTIGAEAAGRT